MSLEKSILLDDELPSYVVCDDFFINWGAEVPVVHFPYHVKQLLYELALNYLLQQPPPDPLDFSIKFLTKLKASKSIGIDYDLVEDDIPSFDTVGMRRNSVFAKAFDPSQLQEGEELEEVCYPKTKSDSAHLKKTLSNLLFFKNLDENEMNKVVNAMFMKPVVKGERVIEQGEDGDYFYVIQSGTFNAYKIEGHELRELCHYNNSGHFGELALLYNQPRAATVIAMTEGVLWCVDRDTFQKIVLTSSFRRSQLYEGMIDNVPILSGLAAAEKVKLADSLHRVEFPNGVEIVRQGDPADGMYFVEQGVVRVLREDKVKGPILVTRLGEGDYFGELALITMKPRACTVVAEGRVRLAFLDVGAFERLLGPCMAIMKRNIKLYRQQLVDVLGSGHSISDLRYAEDA